MKTWKRTAALLPLVWFSSCGDLFEKDISNEQVVLLAPVDGVIVEDDSLTLWWDFVPDASSYRVSLVSPSFDSAQLLFFDSITTDNQIPLRLDQGQYEWRVAAINGGYATDYFSSRFFIEIADTTQVDSTGSPVDLSGVEIQLLTPKDSLVTDSTSINFWWNTDAEVDSFRLTIVRPSFEDPELLVVDTALNRNVYNVQLTAGSYAWKVVGLNRQSATEPFEAVFTIQAEDDQTEGTDLTNQTVSLRAPADSASVTRGEVVFWWDTLASATEYELLILTPSFEAPTVIVLDERLSDDKLQVSLDSGVYQWGVRALNATSGTGYTIRDLLVN